MEQGNEGKEGPRKGLVTAVLELMAAVELRQTDQYYSKLEATKAAINGVHEVAGFQDEHGVIHHVYADNFAHGCIADMSQRLMAYEKAERGSH